MVLFLFQDTIWAQGSISNKQSLFLLNLDNIQIYNFIIGLQRNQKKLPGSWLYSLAVAAESAEYVESGIVAKTATRVWWEWGPGGEF